ncbi:MAG: T9SS type A sorting domain-containing protein, partial [Bacteroidia bacterium]
AAGMSANGNILPGTTDLTYTIRFQNLGTAPAVNVLIKDTIDPNLNISSIQVLASSYPVQMQVNTSTREVDFSFNTIFLPDASANEPGSHGFVRYKINLNPSLPLNTSIKNRGQIFFDYNSAVATNQTINTIVATNIKETAAAKTISLYPNPTNGYLTINSSATITRIEVINALGQTELMKERINEQETSLDLSHLVQGVYFIQLYTTQGVITKKIIRE